MHSIKVRRVDECATGDIEVLAVDIGSAVEAWELVEKLAGSYPRHGTDRREMFSWFESSAGSYQIWAE